MRQNAKIFIIAGLLVGLALAIFVSPFASGSPDGLEKVAAEEGFDDSARDSAVADSPLADYGVDGIEDEKAGTAVSGLIGVLLTFGVGIALFGIVRALRPVGSSDDGATERLDASSR